MTRLFVSLYLLILPSLLHAADIAGLWVGYYAYDPGQNPSRVECAVVFAQVDSEIGGTLVERQTFGDSIIPGLPSDVRGEATGNRVVFAKRYYHAPDAEPVMYELQLSPDGNTMTGFWKIGAQSGTTLFRRVTASSVDRIPAPR